MDLLLSNKSFILVGGTTGMGYAAAEELAREGAQVAIIGRDAPQAAAKADALERRHQTRVVGLSAASGPGGLDAAIDQAIQALGGVHGLAVTAGPMGKMAPFLELSDADWDDYFHGQLMLTVRACRAVLPSLLAQGGGSIVTTAAYSTRAQKPTLSAYAAMKSAIASTTKNIAKTYGGQGIRANCICPGAIATDALAETRELALKKYGEPADQALNRLMIDEWGMKVALNRVGQPHEVGELIAFLLSGRAAYMTGATINIDGGTDF
jgi:NAD(P)-dependent dehydrogenase (short-subunit alcohol dehydrogenase family)